MKRIIIAFLLSITIPQTIFAQQLIISEKNISETVIRDHFSLYMLDDVFIDVEKLSLLINRLEEQVYKLPKNAYLNDRGEIISGKTGVALNRAEFIDQFYHFFYGNQSTQMKLPKKTIYPEIDSELLEDIRNKRIGSYQTYYRLHNKERSHNILLSVESINNHVVLPGKEFSFNEVVGKRTIEKGYLRAPVIVEGELSEDVGGGICQVSSTLYNAVELEGIEITERYSHSRQVPYVPPGKDATVSWWGPDFKFKNNYSHPILIRAKADRGRVLIQIYSSDQVEYKK